METKPTAPAATALTEAVDGLPEPIRATLNTMLDELEDMRSLVFDGDAADDLEEAMNVVDDIDSARDRLYGQLAKLVAFVAALHRGGEALVAELASRLEVTT
jgi:hypothetical protein